MTSFPSARPRVHHPEANGLVHNVLEWGEGTESPVLFLHGFTDAAATWDLVATRVAAAGHRVLAPDFRGFGDGPRAPRGAYYHFPDYVADLRHIVRAMFPEGTRVDIVGHSMGATVAGYFTGAFPESVRRLALLEGVGPPDNAFDVAPDRMRRWIADLAAAAHRDAKLASEEDALTRLRTAHPAVDVDVLKSRLPLLTRRDEAGALTWAYDPLHRTTAPMPFYAGAWKAFAARITCPVLFVGGGPTGFHLPDEAERIATLRDARRVDLDGAGHMMHWSRPEELARALVDFLR